MQSIRYRLIEFFVIFVLVPISFALEFKIWIKMAIGCLGFVYVVYVLLEVENNKFKIRQHINWKQFWMRTSIKLLCIAVLTALYVQIVDVENLFIVVKNKPLLWALILFIYAFFFSVSTRADL